MLCAFDHGTPTRHTSPSPLAADAVPLQVRTLTSSDTNFELDEASERLGKDLKPIQIFTKKITAVS